MKETGCEAERAERHIQILQALGDWDTQIKSLESLIIRKWVGLDQIEKIRGRIDGSVPPGGEDKTVEEKRPSLQDFLLESPDRIRSRVDRMKKMIAVLNEVLF